MRGGWTAAAAQQVKPFFVREISGVAHENRMIAAIGNVTPGTAQSAVMPTAVLLVLNSHAAVHNYNCTEIGAFDRLHHKHQADSEQISNQVKLSESHGRVREAVLG
jgi:hypothetical protein